MKGIAAFGFVLCLTGAAPAAFQGNMNFRNVAITNAAQYRADWRSCRADGRMDWTKAESLGEGVAYLPLKLTVADGWARQMYCHAVRVDTAKPNVRFTGNERCEGWGEPNTEDNPANKTVLKNTVREKTADFIARFRGSEVKGGKARNMIFAVNGQGWGGSDGTSVDYVFGSRIMLFVKDVEQTVLAVKLFCESFKTALEVAHCDAFVDYKSFKLMEKRRVSCIYGV